MNKRRQSVEERLRRLETRVVRGFQGLGVDPCVEAVDDGKFAFDFQAETVYVASPHVTLKQLIDAAAHVGLDLCDWHIAIDSQDTNLLGVTYERRNNDPGTAGNPDTGEDAR